MDVLGRAGFRNLAESVFPTFPCGLGVHFSEPLCSWAKQFVFDWNSLFSWQPFLTCNYVLCYTYTNQKNPVDVRWLNWRSAHSQNVMRNTVFIFSVKFWVTTSALKYKPCFSHVVLYLQRSQSKEETWKNPIKPRILQKQFLTMLHKHAKLW